MLTDTEWLQYRQVINSASASFNKETIIWKRLTNKISRDGDDTVKPTHIEIPLLALIQYNVFRTWPIDLPTDTGRMDNQSILIILNKDYLAELGYINANNNFDYNPSDDYFVVHGTNYQKMGDTHAGQAGPDPVLIFIICERMRVGTTSAHY